MSRSGKKILHIDKNDYYGGAEAALSLQDAEVWASKIAESGSSTSIFTNASISQYSQEESGSDVPKLSFSRAYSLALAPQLIYARSSLLPLLVSSKVYRQLEFLAVGSWWVYSPASGFDGLPSSPASADDISQSRGRLIKVPSGREDIFVDQSLDMKSKRALMKFLRFIAEYEEQSEVWESHRQTPFPSFLSEQFRVPAHFHGALMSLALSSSTSNHTTTEFALARIARHLRSIGMFGPGFGSVIPRWGGLSEIAQVGCRAGAVGGATYVLGKGLDGLQSLGAPQLVDGMTATNTPDGVAVRLKDGEAVTARWIAGSTDDLQPIASQESSGDGRTEQTATVPVICRSISVVASPLETLFPALAEGAPAPAGAVVVFASGSLSLSSDAESGAELPPVHVFVHSSDTGECPAGQSVLYTNVALGGEEGFALLDRAVQSLLHAVDIQPVPAVLWSLRYQQNYGSAPQFPQTCASPKTPSVKDPRVLEFGTASSDLAFDDSMLEEVKSVWQKIMGDEGGDFMVFEDREGTNADADDE